MTWNYDSKIRRQGKGETANLFEICKYCEMALTVRESADG